MTADAPPPRPRVPSAPAWLAGCSISAALLAFCCAGGIAVSVRGFLSVAERELGRELSQQEAEQEADDGADSVLDEMEARLRTWRAADGRFPSSLSEPPPPDPWGTPLRYESRSSDAARISSAGPDRRFDTEDDRVRDIAE